MQGELITEFLEERFKQDDLEGFFVVDVIVKPPNKVEVFIDSDDSLSISHCAKISRILEKKIESENWFGEKYLLNVSSPGLDRPLKKHRQYSKNIGRRMQVKTDQGETLTGYLTKVDDEQIVIKNKKGEENVIQFTQIFEAKILVSFNK